jgi:hypothetical protein
MIEMEGVVLCVPVILTSSWPVVLTNSGYKCTISESIARSDGVVFVNGTTYQGDIELDIKAFSDTPLGSARNLTGKIILLVTVPIDCEKTKLAMSRLLLSQVVSVLVSNGAEVLYQPIQR